MSENKEQSINLNIIFKIIYKNIFLIGLVTVLMAGLAGFYAFTSKSFKSEIILYGNDRVLNEIGENSQYSLNSFDFFRFIQKNSKTLTNTKLPEEKFLKEMSKKLFNNLTKGMKVTKNSYDIENAKVGRTETGRNYAIIPTTVAMEVNGQVVETKGKSMAFEDENKWYIINFDKDFIFFIKGVYPDLAEVKVD